MICLNNCKCLSLHLSSMQGGNRHNSQIIHECFWYPFFFMNKNQFIRIYGGFLPFLHTRRQENFLKIRITFESAYREHLALLVFERTIIRINVRLIFINNRYDPDPDLISGLVFCNSNVLLLEHYIHFFFPRETN